MFGHFFSNMWILQQITVLLIRTIWDNPLPFPKDSHHTQIQWWNRWLWVSRYWIIVWPKDYQRETHSRYIIFCFKTFNVLVLMGHGELDFFRTRMKLPKPILGKLGNQTYLNNWPQNWTIHVFFWNQLAHATGQTWRPFSGPATSDQKYPQIETMCTQWPYQCWNETRIDGQTLECIRDVPTICQ